MKHIQNLQIQQFRGLTDLDLPDLGTITFFVGGNNVGKTSVLEALSLYCRPLDPLAWLTVAKWREMEYTRTPDLENLKWIFPQTADYRPDRLYGGEVLISGDGDYEVREVHACYREFLGLGNNQPNGIAPPDPEHKKLGAELKVMVTSAPHLQERTERFEMWQGERFFTDRKPSAPALPVVTITPFSQWNEARQIQDLSRAIAYRNEGHLLELLRLMDQDIQDLEILSLMGARTSLYIQHKNSGLTPISVIGDGIRWTLSVAQAIAKARDGVLLIDEIETSIHVSALREVFDWIIASCRQSNVQLFATTHSLEAVDALIDPDIERADESSIVVYRLNGLGQPAQRFAGDLLRRMRYKRGLDVR